MSVSFQSSCRELKQDIIMLTFFVSTYLFACLNISVLVSIYETCFGIFLSKTMTIKETKLTLLICFRDVCLSDCA